ncbi:hypothetical protein LCGC14_1465270, partial [marine sediment metagenome]
MFGSLWDFIENQIKNRKILATYLVKEELEVQEDELVDFIKKFDNLFVLPTHKEQLVVNNIINTPKFSYWASGVRNRADPFVVALAKTANLKVVTYENPQSTKKIPAACYEFDVECIT